jgi:hypothetical protein
MRSERPTSVTSRIVYGPLIRERRCGTMRIPSSINSARSGSGPMEMLLPRTAGVGNIEALTSPIRTG